jgi:oxygen-independent coproporphyrinogen-3 oxidase
LDFATYFAKELSQLAEFVEQGMVKLDAEVIEVTPTGWYLVRAIAMVFDKYAQADGQRAHFSKIL